MKPGLLVVCFMLVLSSSTFAHHSATATYVHGQVVRIEGTLKEFVWRNPHSFMKVDVTDKDGATKSWTLEWGSVSQLQQYSITRTSLRPGDKIVVTLKMEAKTLPDVPSRNAVAEIVGSEKPDEVVVLGGHIDSWDVGQGAMDDGGGSVAAWEAVRLIKQLGLKPRRTVRVVLWTNEENGSRGALAYRDTHAAELDKHVLAMESDFGVFKPLGYRVTGADSAVAIARDIASLLSGIGAGSAEAGGPEADVGPLTERGVPAASPIVDGTRYFWYHHSDGDTMDKLNPREMAECVAVMAVMAYIAADMPGIPLAPDDETVPSPFESTQAL